MVQIARQFRHGAIAPIIAVSAAMLAFNAVFAAPSARARASRAAPKPSWKLKFTENFDGARLNERLWSRMDGNPAGPDWQKNLSLRPDLVEVKRGELIVRGVKNDDTSADPRRVLAGGITTKGLMNMKYGKVELRVMIEGQKGAWPAIWMMPEKPIGIWPACGEIDIMEHLASDKFVYQTVPSTWTQSHPNDPPRGGTGPIKPGDWNVYALEWTPERIVWRVNGKETHSYPKMGDSRERWPWDQPMYLMIDMQLGGQWAGQVDESTLPVEMRVDWVKLYQLSIDGKRVSEYTRPGSRK